MDARGYRGATDAKLKGVTDLPKSVMTRAQARDASTGRAEQNPSGAATRRPRSERTNRAHRHSGSFTNGFFACPGCGFPIQFGG